MFGHDDTSNHHDNPEPQHDAVLDDTAQADDTASPAFTMTKPQDASSKTDAPVDTPLPAPAVEQTDELLPAASDDLLNIKQSALKQLSPLVGHLEQTPEEKFRTTMMMIQASDDQSLIKEAYAAAQQINDEKTKAQALLDIINEINYFTQHS